MPIQIAVCNAIKPQDDDCFRIERSNCDISFRNQSIFQITKISKYVNLKIFSSVVAKIASEHRLLRTEFYRNELIVDADWECRLDKLPITVDSYDLEDDEGTLSSSNVLLYSQHWREKLGIDKPFGVLVLQKINDNFHEDQESYIIFGAFAGLLDQISLTWLDEEVFKLYAESFINSDPSSIINNYKSHESNQFHDWANDYLPGKLDFAFWKQQLFVTSIDRVDVTEKQKIVEQLKDVNTFILKSKKALDALNMRAFVIETELEELKRQRKEIDDQENQSDESKTYIDSHTGKMIKVSPMAKKALIKAVLGNEAAEDNIMALLDKHEISKDVQSKLGASKVTLEMFSNLLAGNFEHLGLLTREKKRLIALSEHVRNRIQESINELGKVKLLIERKISSNTRALQVLKESIEETSKALDCNDDMSNRLGMILNPPEIEIRINFLKIHSLPVVSGDVLPQKYGLHRFRIDEDIMFAIQGFGSAWTANIKQKGGGASEYYSDHESLFDSDDEDTSEADSLWTRKNSLNIVCLSAFAVLMKHISGMEKFVLGLFSGVRSTGNVIGPFSDTYPILADLSAANLTFDMLFSSFFHVFRQIKRHGPSFPTFSSKMCPGKNNIPVRFQFITNSERKSWAELGLSVEDLMVELDDVDKNLGNMRSNRICAINEFDKYDLKFIFIEEDHGIEAAISYRSNFFDKEQVNKWVGKFLSTLDQIDPNRKILVSSVISK